jgi:hypothetical protein
VRILFSDRGAPIDGVVERSLWLDSPGPDGPANSIVAPLEPGDYDIDPLSYVPMDTRTLATA